MRPVYALCLLYAGCVAEVAHLVPIPPMSSERQTFPVDINAHGSDGTYVQLTGGSGLLSGHAAVAYESQPWGARVLYQLAAVSDDHLYQAWVYCLDDGTVEGLYLGRTDTARLSYEPLTGTCHKAAAGYPLRLPATRVQLTPVTLDHTVFSNDYALGPDGTGEVGDGTAVVTRVVECRANDCGADWTEYHTVIYTDVTIRTGIFYLLPGGTVVWGYGLAWPSGARSELGEGLWL